MQYLSKCQKATLCQLARRAWELWPEREAFLRANPEYSATAAFEAWRRVQQRQACGVESLRSCTSEHHYLLLRSHWNAAIGNHERAASDLLKHANEARLVVLHKLRESCLERGLDYPGYPGAICRRQYKCALEDAGEKQLWRLVYTVRNRRRKDGSRPAPKSSRRSSQPDTGGRPSPSVQANLPF